MAIVDIFDINGNTISNTELSDVIFGVPVRSDILHQVVTQQLACRREGSAAVKHRSDVSGSTRKLFRQKGTGRARRGNIKSPLLRGGGSVFGPDPRSYAHSVPKKVRRLALKMALSAKLQEGELMVLDRFELSQIKTKTFRNVLRTLNRENALVVIPKADQTLELSSRNLPKAKVLRCEGLNVYDILRHKTLILLESSIPAIERRLTP